MSAHNHSKSMIHPNPYAKKAKTTHTSTAIPDHDNDIDESFVADDMGDDDELHDSSNINRQSQQIDDLEAEYDSLNDIDTTARQATDAILSSTTLELNERAYQRPQLKHIDSRSESIAVQLLECDSHISYPLLFHSDGTYKTSYTGAAVSKRAVIRMYGVNKYGNSVLVNVHGFHAYLWVPVWPDCDQHMLNTFRGALDSELMNSASDNVKSMLPDKSYVVRCDVEQKQSVWGYHFGQLQPFIKFTLALPTLIAPAKRILERGILISGVTRQFSTYESNIPYVLRFMVDHDIKGGGWCEIPANKYIITSFNDKISHCQLECSVTCNSIVAHESIGEWLITAPLRILSFDIECAGRKGFFPSADQDSVITIGNVLSTYGTTLPPQQTVFTLGTCASIVGAHVVQSTNEKDMLTKWMKFFISCDADIITGYNLINFDLPYLLNRAKQLDLKSDKQENDKRGSLSRSTLTMDDRQNYSSRVCTMLCM